MNSQTLNGLPTSFSDQRACYDLDGDGTIEPGMTDGERVVGHGYILDPNGPEFDPEVPFTRTFIYGAYDGEVVLRADDHA